MVWGIVNKPASFIGCMQIEKCSSRNDMKQTCHANENVVLAKTRKVVV